MRTGAVNVGFSLLSLGGIALGTRLALVPLADLTPGVLSGARPTDTASYSAPAIDSLAQVIVPRDPFRVTHRPASIAYDPVIAAQPPAPHRPNPRSLSRGSYGIRAVIRPRYWTACPAAAVRGSSGRGTGWVRCRCSASRAIGWWCRDRIRFGP